MNNKIKEQIIKSIICCNLTEAEIEKLEQCSVHELMDIISKASTNHGSFAFTVGYLRQATEHYKLSGGSIHHEKGSIDL